MTAAPALVRGGLGMACDLDPHPRRGQVTTLERTDPWRWYCRLCGERGERQTGLERDEAALSHTGNCPSGPPHELLGWASEGRLVHVWTYGTAPRENARENHD